MKCRKIETKHGTVVELTINLSTVGLDVCKKLQKASDVDSIEAVIANAIGFYDWAYEEIKKGNKIGVLDAEDNAIRKAILFNEEKKC